MLIRQKAIKPIQQMVGVVILPSVRPVCQLFFFGINPLCGVAVRMHTHATLHHGLNHIFYFYILFSDKQPWASGYSQCFVLKLSTVMHTIFPPLLCCFCLFTLVDDAYRGKMSSDEIGCQRNLQYVAQSALINSGH